MQIEKVIVTKCAAAYQELSGNKPVSIEISAVVNIVPVDSVLGIGKSIIFFRDGTSMNVMESPEELFARRFESF